MKVTRLYFVRHGQSAGNAEGRFGGHSPTPLSSLGKKQAEHAAQALAKEKITAIYSSDLLRAGAHQLALDGHWRLRHGRGRDDGVSAHVY